MFRAPNKNPSFNQLEQKILKNWQKEKTFEQSLKKPKNYIFFDGPPFATGLPHYGHLLAGTIKDIIPRYWTMKGYKINRRFGWDCHGLPIESLVQKKLQLSGNQEIENYGINQFNEACRKSVLTYTSEWEKTVQRMGRWVDFKNDYKTMDLSFMESVWWVFQQCFQKKLIYAGYKIQPYSSSLGTPLSNFETNQGYKDRQDPSLTVLLKRKDADEFFLVWTTTPWTLPSNLAIATHPDIDYVLVQVQEKKYWLSKKLLNSVFPKDNPKILDKKKGSELAGISYQSLFSYAPHQSKKQYTILNADFVSNESGTGFVHIAPSFGEDDFQLGKQENLGLFDPLDEAGCFTDIVPEWKKVSAKDADKSIIRHLKEKGLVLKHETIIHSYPHCYRTDVPLLYRAVKTWFLNVHQDITSENGETKTLKQWMIECNQQINWIPNHIQQGRFGKWIQGAKDWNLSRNRYWGTPIPIWLAEDGDMVCVGSVQELEELTNQKGITDLHKHLIDSLVIQTNDKKTYSPQGKKYYRTSEVLDCWFESGAMPYAQNHYPFENKEQFENNFPADFIAEGLDQTRGWFYTLIVISASLWQKPAFKNVIINGTVLAEDGQKMSKRLQNYPDPNELINKTSADAIRLFMIHSQATKAGDLKFSENGVREMIRSIILPIWNSLNLFTTYANADFKKGQITWSPSSPLTSNNSLDQWIISALQILLKEVEEKMNQYHLYLVVPAILKFIDDLTNWYIRCSRRRFWKSENDQDKNQAYSTLYQVLVTFSQLAAPILPFLCEEIYQTLVAELPNQNQAPKSVHLCNYPVCDKSKIDYDLIAQISLTREVVTLARTIRNEQQIKNRQPLSTLTIIVQSDSQKNILLPTIAMIQNEINVKKIQISVGDSNLICYQAKANFKTLGKRLGKEMRSAAEMISQWPHKTIHKLVQSQTKETQYGTIHLNDIILEKQFPVEMTVQSSKELTVGLDTELTEELIQEGLAREYVNRIQNLRKSINLQVDDQIEVTFYSKEPFLLNVAQVHQNYLSNEILAKKLHYLEQNKKKSEQETLYYQNQQITFSIQKT